MIRLEGVTKVFGQGPRPVAALQDVSLEIADGEFVSVMGPSGSGKSTLLHIMGTLDEPTSGRLWVGGEPLSEQSDYQRTLFRRRKIGFVFQFFNLMPGLTAEENVALPLLLDGRRLSRQRERITALLDKVGLAARRHHKPDEMSGGEMQRVAIARALAIQPLVLLADEPTGNLDSRTGREILKLISDLNRTEKTTVVLVTHDPSAAALAGRTILLKDGRIDSGQ
jgi:putative ABC transport system ATP-binding protein